jgi:NAD(P)-dependent dehydrogenase (short-subunit alcohol dehydrogenase family)
MTNSDFEGKVAIVTGASRGIGAACAQQLARGGAEVVLASRGQQALDSVAATIRAGGGRAMVAQTDMASPESIDGLLETVKDRFGRVDVLISNAGVLPKARRLESYTRDQWNAVLNTNLAGPWQLSCGVKELMPAGGVVVHVSSTAAMYPSLGLGLYCISKAGLAMLTRATALEWADRGIRVVGVVPGKTRTEMVQPILEYVDAHNLPLNPLGRVGEPEEIAAAIVFVAGPHAKFITGSMIAVDGGELISVA